ncbi:hypothetical protein DITRI_Ditri04bG0041400 [Diplodiscus trichospermus]
MGEPSDTIPLHGRLCDTCGDVGYEELIRTCSQCTIQRHLYCMWVIVKEVPDDWVCEVCFSKSDIDSLKSGWREDVMDSLREVDLGRQATCKRQKAVKTGKVKFLPTEEVMKLSLGSPKRKFALKSNFQSKPVPTKSTSTPSPSKRIFMGSKNLDPYFNPTQGKRNPSFLQLGSASPPRCRNVQTSSSTIQHALKRAKETKVESAHVVPNKEIVCKGQILDVILPDKDIRILHTKTDEATRSVEPSPSRLHTTIIDSGRNFHDVEHENSDVAERETWNRLKISLYRPYVPSLYTTWMGSFKFLDTATPGEFYGGFQARPPCRVHRKAYEFSLKMPPVLQVNLLPKCHLQADLFQNGCIDLCDMALYFFPVDYLERSQKNYDQLFQLMEIKNSVMLSYIDGVELLIFSSKQLHADSRVDVVSMPMKMTKAIVTFIDVFTRTNTDFFGGVLRLAKDNQKKVHLPSLVSHSEHTHDDNANMDSSEAVDMDIDMVGGKKVAIPDMAVSKKSMQEFNRRAAKETLDVISHREFSTVSGDLKSVIEPISLESEQECCNDSDLPCRSTEKIKSKFILEPVEHPLASSLGRLPDSMGETDAPPGFEVTLKLSSSDRAPKSPSAEQKIDLGEKQITSRVKEEIGYQGNLQVASGISRPQPHGSIEDASLRGSQKQQQVLAYHLINDPSAACPSPCLLGEGTEVGSVIKIEGTDKEKPFGRRENKGLQGSPFLSQDKSQIAGSGAVKVKAEVQEVSNDHSATCPPHLSNKKTKIGLQIKTEEYDKEKPDGTMAKKALQAGLFNGPYELEVKAEMQKVEYDTVNTSHRLHTTLPSNMATSLCLVPFASTRVKLNVAGRSKGNLGAASAGGLIRDESGKWIAGYNLNLGICSCLATDLWAIFLGLKFAWDRGNRKVLLESDSAAAVEILKKAPSFQNSNRALIESCSALINGDWDCKVCPIRREENLCANWLAAHVEGCQMGLSIIYSPPLELIPLLEDDCTRVARHAFSTFKLC